MNEAYITFIVTQDCQLRCKYCYLIGKNTLGEMSFETAKKAIDYIFLQKEIISQKYVTFDFIGGEPLLKVDLIDEILNYIEYVLKKVNHQWLSNYRINITTNGLLYSNEKVQKLIIRYKEHLNISISIDGNSQKHDLNRIFPNGEGSYKYLAKSIPLWLSQFESVNTRITISHDDLPYLFESLKHLVELGIKNIDVNPVLEDVWQPDDDLVFEKQLKLFANYIVPFINKNKNYVISCFDGTIGHAVREYPIQNPCGANMITVDAKGNFYTCLRFASFSLRKGTPRSIGNIENGINWNLLRPFETINNKNLLSEKCESCEIATGCKFCPAENYDSSQTNSIFDRAINICKMHEAKVNAKNYFFKELNSFTETLNGRS